MAVTSTMLPLGTEAPAFELPDTDAKVVSNGDFEDAPALLVVFMCNHCPYVKHIRDAFVELVKEYQAKGVAVVGINSNDADAYLSRNDDYRSGAVVFGHRIAVEIRKALREEWGAEWFRNGELAKRMERGAARGYDMGINEFLQIWNISEADANLLASPQPQG